MRLQSVYESNKDEFKYIRSIRMNRTHNELLRYVRTCCNTTKYNMHDTCDTTVMQTDKSVYKFPVETVHSV